MKKYVKNAVKELRRSGTMRIEITLKSKNDYKRNAISLLYNKFIFAIQRKFVPSHFKNWLLGTTGLHVGHDACIPHDINFDVYFPELIYVGKGSIIGGECDLFAHKIEENKLTIGKVIMKPRTLIGGMVYLYPGAVINRNCIMNFFSKLDHEVPEGEIWGGMPAKLLKKLSPEEIDKYFIPSNNKYKEYYKEFHKKVKAFRKDPKQTYFKMHYNGKRLNAGNDWWKARNVCKIWYNGVLTELARIAPTSFLRKLLYRIMGVKLGRNVYIGKGVVFDHLYGDLVTVGNNVRLDNDVYLDGHEYTISQTVFGKTNIGNNVHIKHHTYVRAATQIGDNVIVEEKSSIQREIPSNVIWGGFPVAKFIRERK